MNELFYFAFNNVVVTWIASTFGEHCLKQSTSLSEEGPGEEPVRCEGGYRMVITGASHYQIYQKKTVLDNNLKSLVHKQTNNHHSRM